MRGELLGGGKQQSKHMVSTGVGGGGADKETMVLGQKTRRRLTCTVATTFNTTLLSANVHLFL